jgi:hypothetical protein
MRGKHAPQNGGPGQVWFWVVVAIGCGLALIVSGVIKL